MSQKINIGNGLFALVDDCDYHSLSQYKWHSHPAAQIKKRWYATRRPSGGGTLYMHRAILDVPRGLQIDHINGDGLDNRRCNLRICSPSQNSANRYGKVSSTGFRGVYFSKHRNCFIAEVFFKRKRVHIGKFKDPIEAAHARDRAALLQYGDFAVLNFPASQLREAAE